MRQALTLCLLTTCTFSTGDCPRVPRKPFGLSIFTTDKVTRGTEISVESVSVFATRLKRYSSG